MQSNCGWRGLGGRRLAGFKKKRSQELGVRHVQDYLPCARYELEETKELA